MTDFYCRRQSTAPRYVSAVRLYLILRTKVGCTNAGWRDQESWYWMTPNGVAFSVADPSAGPNCRAVLGAGTRQELCYPYENARQVLARANEMMAGPNKRHRLLVRRASRSRKSAAD